MNREIQINIPIFIGVILIVAIVSGILVYSINSVRNKVQLENEKMSSDFQSIANVLNIQK